MIFSPKALKSISGNTIPNGRLLEPNTPKEVDSKVEESFDSLIGANGYRIISDPACSPLHVGAKYGRNYVCSLIVGTVYNPRTPIASNSPYVPQVKSRINLEKGWRICSHDGTKHFNSELHYCWKGQDGKLYYNTTKKNPDHYVLITSGTTLPDLRNEDYLPEQDCGLLEELGYQKHELSVDFLGPAFEMTAWKDKKPLP